MRKLHFLILSLILSIGLFFRTYQIIERFEFAHDADLYSWIVKDIVVNHHFRLIGQLTSAPGIFIGPLFYYLLVPFFILAKMDPVGVLIPSIILGIFTMFSYYYVFSRLFNQEIGLIGAFLYAVLLATIGSDRWVVPTVTSSIWSIWYFFIIVKFSQRDFSVLPFLGILIGLIWHIHIALVPILITIPIVLIRTRKIPGLKQIIGFLLITLLASSPFIIFEARHNFSQTRSMFNNFTANFGMDKNISEIKELVLGSQNNNAKLNLDPASKFSLEVEPQTPKIGDTVNLKITTKNPKYSTLVIITDCGNPKQFEIGSITAVFKWSTVTCSEGNHKIIAIARTSTDPPLKIIFDKFINVLGKENTNINNLFIFPLHLPGTIQYIVTIVILLSPLFAWRMKSLTTDQFLICYAWILAVFLFFSFSSIIVSEYYLASISVIFISSITVILHKIYQIKPLGQYFIPFLLFLLLTKNFLYYISLENYDKGYLEKKALVEYIAKDMQENDYPCIGISYITALGENTGFRYLFYINKIHLIHPSLDVPVYNIFIPEEFSQDKTKQKFGHIAVTTPTNAPPKEIIQKSCQTPNTNLTDSMLGYTD